MSFLSSSYSRTRARSAWTFFIVFLVAAMAACARAYDASTYVLVTALCILGWMRPREVSMLLLGLSSLVSIIERGLRAYVAFLFYAIVAASAAFRASELTSTSQLDFTDREHEIAIVLGSQMSWQTRTADALGRAAPELRWLLFPFLLLMRSLSRGKKSSLRIPTGNYTLS